MGTFSLSILSMQIERLRPSQPTVTLVIDEYVFSVLSACFNYAIGLLARFVADYAPVSSLHVQPRGPVMSQRVNRLCRKCAELNVNQKVL